MSSAKKQCPPRCGSQIVDQRKKSIGNRSSSIASRYNCMSSGGVSKKSNKVKQTKQSRKRNNVNNSAIYSDKNTKQQSHNNSRNSHSINNNNSNHLSHSRRSYKPNTTIQPMSTPSKMNLTSQAISP